MQIQRIGVFFKWLLLLVVLFFHRRKAKSKLIFINLIDFEESVQNLSD